MRPSELQVGQRIRMTSANGSNLGTVLAVEHGGASVLHDDGTRDFTHDTDTWVTFEVVTPDWRDPIVNGANRIGDMSRRGGAPMLSASSSRQDLIAWLQWNDPHGSHTDAACSAEGFDPYTLEDAWEQLGRTVNGELGYGPTPPKGVR